MGTPYMEVQDFARVIAQGKDKRELKALAAEAFDAARQTRVTNKEAAVRFLCLASAYNLIAGEAWDGTTAVTNLGLLYEQMGQYETAVRVQGHALAAKQQLKMPAEHVARSEWLIGRSLAALGNYMEARRALQAAVETSAQPRIAKDLSWVNEQLRRGTTKGALPPD